MWGERDRFKLNALGNGQDSAIPSRYSDSKNKHLNNVPKGIPIYIKLANSSGLSVLAFHGMFYGADLQVCVNARWWDKEASKNPSMKCRLALPTLHSSISRSKSRSF